VAKIDANWIITVEPQDVIALSKGLGVDAWPDEGGGDAISIRAVAACTLDNDDFMTWLDDQNFRNVEMVEFLRNWWNVLTRVKGNSRLMSDVSQARRAELMTSFYDELGSVMHHLNMLNDEDVFHTDDES
jgi:hypothetical protein